MRLGKGGTESELVRAFRELGSPDTFPTIPWAADYLNSGNNKLEAAAREWMSAHGYTEVPSPIGGGGGWGTIK